MILFFAVKSDVDQMAKCLALESSAVPAGYFSVSSTMARLSAAVIVVLMPYLDGDL